MKKKQFIVLGLGRFGRSVAEELYEHGADVLAVDLRADLVDGIQGRVTHAVQADATDPSALEQLGIRDFDAAIVTIGMDIRASSVITMLLKEMKIPTVIAKAQDEMHGRMLKKLGADRIIYAERDMGRRIAHSLLSDNILDYIEVSPDVAIVEIVAPASWVNQPLGILNLRRRFGINVIAIRSGKNICVSLNADTIIRPDDKLLVVGEQADLNRLKCHR